MADEVIELNDLTLGQDGVPSPRPGADQPSGGGGSLDEAERQLILTTLERCSGDKKRAAEILGISLKTLYNRLNLYART